MGDLRDNLPTCALLMRDNRLVRVPLRVLRRDELLRLAAEQERKAVELETSPRKSATEHRKWHERRAAALREFARDTVPTVAPTPP